MQTQRSIRVECLPKIIPYVFGYVPLLLFLVGWHPHPTALAKYNFPLNNLITKVLKFICFEIKTSFPTNYISKTKRPLT